MQNGHSAYRLFPGTPAQDAIGGFRIAGYLHPSGAFVEDVLDHLAVGFHVEEGRYGAGGAAVGSRPGMDDVAPIVGHVIT